MTFMWDVRQRCVVTFLVRCELYVIVALCDFIKVCVNVALYDFEVYVNVALWFHRLVDKLPRRH